MLRIKEKVVGFTLIELMIALTINLLLFAGLIVFFSSNIKQYKFSSETNKLNEEITSTLNYMAGEISRAGYWGNAADNIGQTTNINPFMANDTDIYINANNNCILLTYDMDDNGTLSEVTSASADERVGFRLINGAIQARPPGAPFDCNAAASQWENLTDPNIITITTLTFTPSNTTTTLATSVGLGVIKRAVNIVITGQLNADTSFTKTVSLHTRVRNDKLIP